MTEPAISVVVPTFERSSRLAATLRAYENQEPGDLPFEVIVIDDGSGDDTSAVLEAHRSRRFALKHERQANRGPAAARNRGLSIASAPLIFFTGDDILPTSDLLARHVTGHAQASHESTAVLGRIDWVPDLAVTTTMRHIDGPGAQQFSFLYLEDGATYDFRHLYTSNISLRRSLLEREPGPFSLDFPFAAFEDAELGYRLARHGLEVVYHAKARAYHHHVYDARQFFERQRRCGAMAAVLCDKHPELAELVRVPPLKPGLRHRLFHRKQADDVQRVEAAIEEAVELAVALDPYGLGSVDPFLRALFDVAYQQGALEHRLEPEEVAARLTRPVRHLSKSSRAARSELAKLDIRT